MKRLINYLVMSVMILSAALSVSSCDKDEEEPRYTVRFDSKGGTPTPQEQTVMKGDKVSKPADPTSDGFEFGGWAKANDETSALWNFETETVNESLTLYARWTAMMHLVTFNSNGGSEVAAQNVAHGNKATKPANPSREGYEFDGWFDGTLEWDFATAVTAPVTLTAQWTSPPKLDFSNDDMRKDIATYLRATYQQWRRQASAADLENADENYRQFLRNTGIEKYLIDRLSRNNALTLNLFDGLKAEYSKEDDAFICRGLLGAIDSYEVFTFIGFGFIDITIRMDYPLRVENVFNTVLGKYASAKPSTFPTDFNNTLLTALIAEAKSGLSLGPIYGRSQLEMNFNTLTGDVYAGFYSGGYGEMMQWDNPPTTHTIWSSSGHPYLNLWTGLWDTVRHEFNATYTSQNLELQKWDSNTHYLDLHLSGYNPYKYKLTVYIYVDGTWWIKPRWERSFPVGFDTHYQIPTNTGGVDATATVVAAMILPIDSYVNIDSYSAAKAVAVNYKEIKR